MNPLWLPRLREVERLCACNNIRKASRALAQLFNEALKPSGLRATQFALLVAIATTGAASLTHLGQRLVMDRTTLTRSLKPLEKRGLVAIATGEDRRTRAVTLTARGREALARALPLWERAQARVVRGLGQKRWRALLASSSAAVELTRRA